MIYPQTEEQIVGDWLYSLRQREDVDENRITLTGTLSAADWVWRLGSHFPQWFAEFALLEVMEIPMKLEP